MEKTNNENYYCIKFKGCNGPLSIHESKELSYNEYHQISSNKTNSYQILVEVEKTVGENIKYWNLSKESYKNYEFKEITYPIINDFTIDGFEYDKQRKVVLYGYIYGIYAVKKDNDYYDVITGDRIPSGIIERETEMTEYEDLSCMLEDLEIIERKKDVYIRLTGERIFNLSKGAANRQLAIKRYNQKYEENIKLKIKHLNNTNIRNETENEKIDKTHHQIKEMIYRIRNNI